MAHADRLPAKGRILVPLAGKAIDLIWLEEHDYEVVGVEFVQNAIDQFREEHPKTKVKMIRGDMFAQTPEAIGTFDAIYDRAALIALDPPTRARYLEVCSKLAKPGAPTFLIAFAYDQTKSPGPPFSLDEATIRDLFAGRTVEIVGKREASISPRMREAGVDRVDETAYLVR